MNKSDFTNGNRINVYNRTSGRIGFATVDELAAAFRPTSTRLRILLLADDAHPADVVLDHIEAIRFHSFHRVTMVNPIRRRYGWSIRLVNFDIIIVHYSICILSDYHFSRHVFEAVREFEGPKIQIIQDEYRWIDRMTHRMSELGIHAVFSSLTPENAQRVYHHKHLANMLVVSGLPGYISERMKNTQRVDLRRRSVDLVYRGRPLPIWLGKCSEEKVEIGRHAIRMAQRYGLTVDCKVKEEDRVYGKRWTSLLMKGRATLATEGGATVFDFDDSIESTVGAFQRQHPTATARDVWKALVKPHDGKIVHRTITPRVFEAILCGTALILYPGSYRGILKPWEHYIPLERDGTNDAKVCRLLKDDAWLSALISRAYHRVADDPFLQSRHYVAATDAVANELAVTVVCEGTSERKSMERVVEFSFLLPIVGMFETWMAFLSRVFRRLRRLCLEISSRRVSES